jgi:hypothetical protein
MLLLDVNILVYAHREDAPEHGRYRSYLEGVVNGREAYGVAELVLSGFLRIVTHPKVFTPPSPLETALEFVEQFRSQPNSVLLAPGRRHWEIFTALCAEGRVKGNLVADAYLAALAVESGSEWVTTDRDFARFRGLRCRHPFEA